MYFPDEQPGELGARKTKIAFAWWPTIVVGGKVWLERYDKVYEYNERKENILPRDASTVCFIPMRKWRHIENRRLLHGRPTMGSPIPVPPKKEKDPPVPNGY